MSFDDLYNLFKAPASGQSDRRLVDAIRRTELHRQAWECANRQYVDLSGATLPQPERRRPVLRLIVGGKK